MYDIKSPRRTTVTLAVSALLASGVLFASSSLAATRKTTKTAKAAATTTTAAATTTAAPTTVAAPASQAFSIALTGDMPYDAAGVQAIPNVIKDINESKVAFTLFDGDTMSGKGDKCNDERYTEVKSIFFDQFAKPIFYSVGDNEWVDCDRSVKGSYVPTNRLDLVRKVYFGSSTNQIFLGKSRLTAPGSTTPVDVIINPAFPELQMFTYRGITVIIPHIPGSANNSAVESPKCKTYNDTKVDGDAVEFATRDAANVAWINKGFEKAKADKAIGVIVVVQANLDWEGYLAGEGECTQAYDADKQALLTNTLKFGKPVLLQNGDEHWYQVDMPMNETAGKLVQRDKGSLVEHFTRVQTFGSGFNHWVELVVDPSDPNLWSFRPHIIKANLTAH